MKTVLNTYKASHKIYKIFGYLSLLLTFNLAMSSSLFAQKTQKDTTKVKKSIALKGIKIISRRNKFSTGSSNFVAKMPLKNLENPQSYTVVTHALIKNQMAVTYSDAFKSIPGTEIPVYANNGRMDISSRGFKVRSQIIDGMSGYTMTDIDPANIQSIEIIRGPSATLFGSSLTSYGGLVNIVTKKPYEYFGGNVSYYLGSFGFNRLTADVNTPLNKKRNLLFRINAAGQTGKSYQDAGFAKSVFAAPSITFKPNKNIKINTDLEYYSRRATSPFWFAPYKKTKIADVRDLGMDNGLSFMNNDVFYNAEQLDGRLSVDINLGKNWKSTTLFSATQNKLNGKMMSLSGISDSVLTHSVSDGPQDFSTIEAQQNFLNDTKFNKFRNRLLVGLDFYHYKSDESTASVEVGNVNFINPEGNYGLFNENEVDEALKSATYKHIVSTQNTYSSYFSDVFSFNKKWFLMASLRLDRFENEGDFNPTTEKITGKFGQTALSPKVGLVYQPIKDKLSLYANYLNGFSNVNGTDYDGNSFKPQHANQLEAGVKTSFWHKKLTGTVSVYQILVDNMLRDDLDHPQFSVQDGTELSKGVELSLAANPVSGLNIIAGYSFNYCVYKKADEGLQGTRPDGAGPQNTANIWANYQFQEGKLSGLGIGVGGRYGSNLDAIKHFIGEFYVPSYTVFDATVYYSRNYYRISFKVNNFTDETYWNNRLMPETPISFIVGISLNLAALKHKKNNS